MSTTRSRPPIPTAIDVSPDLSVRRLEPAEESAARHTPRGREVIFLENFGRVPAAGGPVLNRTLDPLQVDDPAYQRRLRGLGDLACGLAALTSSFSYQSANCRPLKRLVNTISGSKPHMARWISERSMPSAAPSGGTRRRFHMIRAARSPAALSLNTSRCSKGRALGSGYPA